MSDYFNTNFPDVADLKRQAKKRIPKFAFDYLGGIHTINSLMLQLTQIMNQLGCNNVANLPNHLVR